MGPSVTCNSRLKSCRPEQKTVRTALDPITFGFWDYQKELKMLTPRNLLNNWYRIFVRQLTNPSALLGERAHRILTPAPTPETPPFLFIMKILNYRDRGKIFVAARRMAEIKYENTNLSFYPYYTLEVHKQRRQFSQVRAWLREWGWNMLYLTRLRVQDQERTHYFTIPEEVSYWLDQHSPKGQ